MPIGCEPQVSYDSPNTIRGPKVIVRKVELIMACKHYRSPVYMHQSSYLNLTISDWIRAKKVELGAFDLIVFREDDHVGDDDMVERLKSISVYLKMEYIGANLEGAQELHNYFTRRFIEGFERVDQHFNTNLARELRSHLEVTFAMGQYSYEKQVAAKRFGGTTVRVFHHYTGEKFQMLLRFVKKNEVIREAVIATFRPDPFIVRMKFFRVEFIGENVRVINKSHEEVLLHPLNIE